MLRAFFLALCLSLGLNLPAVSAETPPDVLARTTSQEVLAVLKADKDIQRGDLSKIYELVEAKVLPNFDFNRMTQLAMGRHWPKASAQQKQVLVAEFRNLLVRTYATSLTEFGGPERRVQELQHEAGRHRSRGALGNPPARRPADLHRLQHVQDRFSAGRCTT
jgi:ABC-type transporter MlaC component